MSTAAAPPAPITTPTPSPAPTGGASSLVAPVVTPDPVAPPAPTEYTLQLPDGSALPADAIERTTAIARELGLSNDAAQRMLTSMDAEAATVAEARATAAREEVMASYQPGGTEWTKQAAEWERATLEDTRLGKTPDERKAAIQRGVQVIDKYAQAHPKQGQALRAMLNRTGMGNHPDVVGLFAWLGKSAGEPQTFVPGTQAEEKDQKKVWFPNTKFPGQEDSAA